MSDTTVDAIFAGRVHVEQSVAGYRFNVDSILLTAFAQLHVGQYILDVGAGSGVVGLGLAALDPQRRVVMAERQAALAKTAADNIVRNAMQDRCTVVHEDIREMRGRKHHFDGAVMNPPYFQVGAGRQSPDNERANARHEIYGTIRDLVVATARHLYADAPLCVVFPAQRAGALFAALEEAGRRQYTAQWVYPLRDRDASLVLVAARASRTHTQIIPAPLILHEDTRAYTPQAQAIVNTGCWSRSD